MRPCLLTHSWCESTLHPNQAQQFRPLGKQQNNYQYWRIKNKFMAKIKRGVTDLDRGGGGGGESASGYGPQVADLDWGDQIG